MALKALLFGSIGTLVDSSEIQREAYNRAFAELGLDWHWNRDTYRAMLVTPDGTDRIRQYAKAREENVSPALIHRRKVAHFGAMANRLKPRPGLAETVRAAKAEGLRVGLVSTTSTDQISITLRVIDHFVKRSDFDFICDETQVYREKPSPDAYFYALSELGLSPFEAVALEDTPECARSAMGAGIRVLGVPGVSAQHRMFPAGVPRLQGLDPEVILAGASSSNRVA